MGILLVHVSQVGILLVHVSQVGNSPCYSPMVGNSPCYSPMVGLIYHRWLFPGWVYSPLGYSGNVRTVGNTAGETPLGNNPDLKGNREGKAEKPATESDPAQGCPECEEPSSRD